VMALGALAFFQAARMDRLVTRNTADRVRAELAAESGLAAGQALINGLFTNYPDSAVGWVRLEDTELAAFYFRTTDTSGFQSSGANAARPSSDSVFLFVQPLASGANAVQTSAFIDSSVVFTNTNTTGGLSGLSPTNSFDLNRDNWIGSPPGGSRPVLKAKWVELLQDPTQPKNTNLNTAGQPINPPVARYVFWAEDESFRVNINTAGATDRGATSLGTNASEVVLQGALSDNNTGLAAGILSLQTALRSNIPSIASISLAAGGTANSFQENKYVLTLDSSALNLSRGGVLRVNLNQVVNRTTSSTEIRAQLDRILASMTNQFAMPSFGQRFYRTNSFPLTTSDDLNSLDVSTDNRKTDLYLQKVAANIRDYIDPDSQPTVLNNDTGFSVNQNTAAPWNAFADGAAGGNGPVGATIAAVGKEAVPLLTEYAVRVLLTEWRPRDTGAAFAFRLFHYFEFWNPTTKDIPLAALGGNPQLTIMNLYNFNVGGGTIAPAIPPVTSISLAGFAGLTSFPANSFTVLTTESAADAPTCPFPGNADFKRCGQFTEYRGFSMLETNDEFRVRPILGGAGGRAGPSSGSDGTTDYDVWMMIANTDGILESFTALPTAAASGADPGESNAMTIHNDTGNNLNNPDFKWRAGNLRGNDILSRSGDPRSLHEQMTIERYSTGSSSDLTRFFNNANLNNVSFGSLNAGTKFADPTEWPDYSPDIVTGAGGSLAPYRQLDGPLDSIGRLGDVYDPVLFFTGTQTVASLEQIRGGGRTLKIGQAERWMSGALATSQNPLGLWDGLETSASRNWTAWRLTDVFCTTPPDRNGNGAVDFDEQVRLEGLININGAMRDPGALAALVHNLTYQAIPDGADATQNRALLTTGNGANNFLKLVGRYLANTGSADASTDTNPSDNRLFWERGQLSELSSFSGNQWVPTFSISDAAATPLTRNTVLSSAQDRGREELFRRLIELSCTKGNTYTVYAVGQSLNPKTGRPTATHRMQRTFRISPFYRTGFELDSDATFQAGFTDSGRKADRFRRPDGYTNQILRSFAP